MKSSWFSNTLLLIACLYTLPGCVPHEENIALMAQENSKTAESVYKVGETMHKSGDIATASKMYKQALELDPDYIPAYVGLGQVARETNHLKDMIILLEKTLIKHPANEMLMLEIAKLYLADNRGEKAETVLQECLKKKENFDNLNLLGVALDLQERHPEAQAFYKRALSIDPYHTGCLANMRLSLALEGEYEKSLKILEPLMERDHPSSRDRQNLALVYALSGQSQKAENLYKMELDPDTTEKNMIVLKKLAPHIKNQPELQTVLPIPLKKLD